jgi:ABC-type spermidine/putrescine transport system permease subunit II
MITTYHRKLMLIAGAALLVAVALVLPFDAFASTTDLKKQTEQLGTQIFKIPRLLALAAYAMGAFFAISALFKLKGFIEAPDDNPITQVMARAAIAALLILLPYVITLARESIGAQNSTLTSASSQFNDPGTF